MVEKCGVCSKEARQFCSSCKTAFYCSRDCQKQDWKRHKGQCAPFVVEKHPQYGRYVVAKRDIKPGEVLLKEAPLMVGPKHRSKPLCLGCHASLNSWVKCPNCSFPLCSTACQYSLYHKAECQILSKCDNTFDIVRTDSFHPAYECISALRCCLTKLTDTEAWNKLNQLQHHLQEIRDTPIFKANQVNTVKFIKNFVGWDEVTNEEIERMCGVLCTNSFELVHNGHRVRGLYSRASMFAHSCMPNTKHVVDKDLNVIFISTVKIPAGSPITTTYTQILWNTSARRKHLKLVKFFLCNCSRCEDPTEIGTELGTLICCECKGNVRCMDPLETQADFACERCDHRIPSKQVEWGDKMLDEEIRSIDKNKPERLESFLERYKNTLHEKHRFFVEIKYALIKYYGNVQSYFYKDLSQNQIDNKVLWCRELLELADVIDGGYSELRGTLLFELQAALVAQAKTMLSNDLITEKETSDYMNEAVKILQEATQILQQDPLMKDGGLDLRLQALSTQLEI